MSKNTQLPTWSQLVSVATLKAKDDYQTKVKPAVRTTRSKTASGLSWLAKLVEPKSTNQVTSLVVKK